MMGFRKLGDKLFSSGLTRRGRLGARMGGGGDTTAPTVVITCDKSSPTAETPLTFTYTWSEDVTGFEVGDAGITNGSKGAFTAVSDKVYTLVVTPDNAGSVVATVAAGVCQDAAGNANTEATPLTISIIVTLTIQPDAADGMDTFIFGAIAVNNYGTDIRCIIGDLSGGTNTIRQLIKFSFTSIPAGSTIISAVLSLYANGDDSSNARTFRVFRQKRAWVEGTRNGAVDNPATGATWERYDTTNNWQTAGGFGANDCEQTDIGTRDFTATETLNQYKNFTLTSSKIQEMIPGGVFTNNGFLIKADTENTDAYEFASSDAAANRPKIVIVYSTP